MSEVPLLDKEGRIIGRAELHDDQCTARLEVTSHEAAIKLRDEVVNSVSIGYSTAHKGRTHTRREVRRLLLQSEDTFLHEVRNSPVFNHAYHIGVEEDLTLGQMALLVLPELLTELRTLRVQVKP